MKDKNKPMFKDSFKGATFSCDHTKDGTICDSCLGLKDKTKLPDNGISKKLADKIAKEFLKDKPYQWNIPKLRKLAQNIKKFEDKTKPEDYCQCKHPIISRVGTKNGDTPINWDELDTCQQCAKHMETKPEEWKNQLKIDFVEWFDGVYHKRKKDNYVKDGDLDISGWFGDKIEQLKKQWTDKAYQQGWTDCHEKKSFKS